MGTRGNVFIREHKTGRILVNMYNHMDSYPSGLGDTLAQFLENRKIVNGIGGDEGKISNGIGCFAAQLVTELKGDSGNAGGVYIEKPFSPLNDPNDYTYMIYPVTRIKRSDFQGKKWTYYEPTGGLMVVVHNWNDKIFEGTAAEFVEWIKNIDV